MDINATKYLVQAVQELSMARTLDEVMTIVRTVAREVTGADGATFVLRDGDMCYYADEDAISPLWKGSRFPMSTCISGWVMLNKKSVVIEDIYQDERIPHDAYRPTFVKSLAMVPIRTLDPIGAIGNYWARNFTPTKDQISILQSLADVTAVTMENISVYNELEQRVKNRTAELEATNAKLKEAYDELEAFSYSVSHDLRAPLRSVIGYANILQEDHADQLNDGGKRSLTLISKNAERMNVLIDDLLRFSRLTRQELERMDIHTDKVVEEVIKNQPQSSNVDFTIHDLPSVFGDRRLLTQVWDNLISNAIKYSAKKDHPTIEIGATTSERESVFYVKDNGAGFDMAYADKLFGVFQRLHHAREFEGNGIGLALVKRIVTRHGGRVWAESSANKGATFYFSLPTSH